MVAPFLKEVSSLEELKDKGTNAEFFSGSDYTLFPTSLCDSSVVRSFVHHHFSMEEIRSSGIDDGDVLSLFVLCIGEGSDKEKCNAFIGILDDEIRRSALKFQDRLMASLSTLDPDLDGDFDALSSVCDLRNFLLRLRGKLKSKQYRSRHKGAALIVEI